MQVVGFNYNVDIHIVAVRVEVWCGIQLSNGRGHGEVCLEEKR